MAASSPSLIRVPEDMMIRVYWNGRKGPTSSLMKRDYPLREIFPQSVTLLKHYGDRLAYSCNESNSTNFFVTSANSLSGIVDLERNQNQSISSATGGKDSPFRFQQNFLSGIGFPPKILSLHDEIYVLGSSSPDLSYDELPRRSRYFLISLPSGTDVGGIRRPYPTRRQRVLGTLAGPRC